MSAFTDDDVQAAIRAYWRIEDDRPLSDGFMRAAIAAVAPAIAARAAATVLRETASVLRKIGDHGADGEATPYETADWLTTRADEIERTP